MCPPPLRGGGRNQRGPPQPHVVVPAHPTWPRGGQVRGPKQALFVSLLCAYPWWAHEGPTTLAGRLLPRGGCLPLGEMPCCWPHALAHGPRVPPTRSRAEGPCALPPEGGQRANYFVKYRLALAMFYSSQDVLSTKLPWGAFVPGGRLPLWGDPRGGSLRLLIPFRSNDSEHLPRGGDITTS